MLQTEYRPYGRYLMIVPLEDITSVGNIVLPDSAVIRLNEGHVVAVGDDCDDNTPVGSCVTWPQGVDYRMRTDDGASFVLVGQTNIIMVIKQPGSTGQEENIVDHKTKAA